MAGGGCADVCWGAGVRGTGDGCINGKGERGERGRGEGEGEDDVHSLRLYL